MSDDKPSSEDVALVCGPTEDGAGARIVRAKDGVLSAGEIRPAREGQPTNGSELIRLRPRPGAPRVCDVDVLHAPQPAAPKARVIVDGPAQVATRDYRHNWDRIFGADVPAERNNALN